MLFAVMVDMSGSETSTSDLMKKAALQLFQALSPGNNRGYIVLFNDVVVSSNRAVLVPQMQSVLNAARFHGGTAIYDAIQQTCLQKLSRSGNLDTPRRAILLISDGDDDASFVTHTKAEEAAEREGVAVFSLVTRSSRASAKGEHFLQALSHDTGAQAISSSNVTDGVAPLLSAIEMGSDLPACSIHRSTIAFARY